MPVKLKPSDPTYAGQPIDANGDPLPPPAPIIENIKIDPAGTKVKVEGVVEGEYLGGAVVQFPTATGGSIGVPTKVKAAVGDLVTLDAEVIEATREVVRVTFQTPDGGAQEAELARFRTTFP